MQCINKPGVVYLVYQTFTSMDMSFYTIFEISGIMLICPVLSIQFCTDLPKVGSRDSSVGIATGYGLNGQGSFTCRGRDLSLLQCLD
jgi:hypothetical protein